jgi:DNA-binding MarR family transcriptional regulator
VFSGPKRPTALAESPIDSAAIAIVKGMNANNVVLLLNELEQLGYISRRRDPSDRRRHLVDLTPAGAKALSNAEHRQESIEDDVLKALDDDERATLWRLLGQALRGAEPELDVACEPAEPLSVSAA